ncbi:hypothetical protein, partial [Mesorhizobium sp.]|uniref:hypothetical protein n=1 Tax=Mesorhizobium sp. TaxID=1871066 RepID=UPI0025E78DB2
GRLRAGKRVKRAQGGAGLEGGVGVAGRTAGSERPDRNDRRRGGTGGRGIEANHAFEGKAAVRFPPSISRQNAQPVEATKRMIMLPYRSFWKNAKAPTLEAFPDPKW